MTSVPEEEAAQSGKIYNDVLVIVRLYSVATFWDASPNVAVTITKTSAERKKTQQDTSAQWDNNIVSHNHIA